MSKVAYTRKYHSKGYSIQTLEYSEKRLLIPGSDGYRVVDPLTIRAIVASDVCTTLHCANNKTIHVPVTLNYWMNCEEVNPLLVRIHENCVVSKEILKETTDENARFYIEIEGERFDYNKDYMNNIVLI